MVEDFGITIYRPSSYLNGGRTYKVFLDNRHIASIGNGETICLNPDTGKHLIYIKIDYIKSNVLEINIDRDRPISLIVTIRKITSPRSLLTFALIGICAKVGAAIAGPVGSTIGAGIGVLTFGRLALAPILSIVRVKAPGQA